jgi:hypothetical protein
MVIYTKISPRNTIFMYKYAVIADCSPWKVASQAILQIFVYFCSIFCKTDKKLHLCGKFLKMAKVLPLLGWGKPKPETLPDGFVIAPSGMQPVERKSQRQPMKHMRLCGPQGMGV